METKEYTLYATAKKFLPFIRPYVVRFAVAVSLLVVITCLSLLPPFLLGILIDRGIKVGNSHFLNLIAIYLIAALIVMGALRGTMDYIHEWVSAWLIYDIRSQVFEKIQEQSLDFFSTHKTGDILSRLRTDVTAVYGVMVNTFLSGFAEAIQVVGVLAFMFYLSRVLTLLALVFVPCLYAVLALTGKRIRKLSLEFRDKDASLLQFFHEVISNIHIVKLYAREDYMMKAHAVSSQRVISVGLRRSRAKFVSMFLIGTVTGLAPVLFLWYGGNHVIGGTLSFGSFIAFYLYASRLYAPIQSLANRGVEIYNGLASAQRIAEYFDLRSSIVDPPRPVCLSPIEGEVSFDHVVFHYPGTSRNVLSEVSLRVMPREKIAVVGPSGAGKTTLISLLCRLYDPDVGSILLDGNDVRTLSLRFLRESVGVVSQEIFLFHDTILENIRFGRTEATDADVMAAAKAAHLHGFIQTLADKYDTVVGTRGMKLSGGQRQRMALARVILKNSSIWVLDEFTSALDSETEAVIYENIAPLLKDKTAITIAHRLSTVMSADRVIVLQDGRVVETGTHQSLYRLEGLYRKLFEAQMQARSHTFQELPTPV